MKIPEIPKLSPEEIEQMSEFSKLFYRFMQERHPDHIQEEKK